MVLQRHGNVFINGSLRNRGLVRGITISLFFNFEILNNSSSSFNVKYSKFALHFGDL